MFAFLIKGDGFFDETMKTGDLVLEVFMLGESAFENLEFGEVGSGPGLCGELVLKFEEIRRGNGGREGEVKVAVGAV